MAAIAVNIVFKRIETPVKRVLLDSPAYGAGVAA
jgi:hypothetical protein